MSSSQRLTSQFEVRPTVRWRHGWRGCSHFHNGQIIGFSQRTAGVMLRCFFSTGEAGMFLRKTCRRVYSSYNFGGTCVFSNFKAVHYSVCVEKRVNILLQNQKVLLSTSPFSCPDENPDSGSTDRTAWTDSEAGTSPAWVNATDSLLVLLRVRNAADAALTFADVTDTCPLTVHRLLP